MRDVSYGFDESTFLLVIDIQDRLLPALIEPDQKKLIRYTSILVELASDIKSPIVYSEQYPKGLGATVPELLKNLKNAERFEKTTFNLCDSPHFSTTKFTAAVTEATHLKTIIICGMEAHICVLATVCSLRQEGYRVLVPIDAVASRTKENYKNGLDLMEKAGAILVNTETIVFQTLKHSKSDHFKKYSKLIL